MVFFNLIDLIQLLRLTSLHIIILNLIVIISALKSTSHTDTRSPIHIDTIKTLIDLEIEVWFEEGVGSGINVNDSAFEDIGLKKHSRNDCLKNANLLIQ